MWNCHKVSVPSGAHSDTLGRIGHMELVGQADRADDIGTVTLLGPVPPTHCLLKHESSIQSRHHKNRANLPQWLTGGSHKSQYDLQAPRIHCLLKSRQQSGWKIRGISLDQSYGMAHKTNPKVQYD